MTTHSSILGFFSAPTKSFTFPWKNDWKKHNSGKTRLNTAFWALCDTTDPLHNTVIMPISGYMYVRGLRFCAYRFNNCKEKQTQKKFKNKNSQTLHIHDVPFTLNFRRGASSTRPPPSKPRAEPHWQCCHSSLLNLVVMASPLCHHLPQQKPPPLPTLTAWPAAVFSSGESHRQRSLEGYSPWGRKRVQLSKKTL